MMYHPFLIGEKLYLRAFEKKDLENEAYFQWLNDYEVTRFMMTGVFPNSPERMEEFYRNVASNHDNVFLAIIDKGTDKHIGNIRLGPIDRVSLTSPLGLMIGDKTFWGKGNDTESIQLITDYGFRRLNLYKIWAGVVSINQSSIRAFEKAGFIQDGMCKNHFFNAGKYYDILYFSFYRDKFVSHQSEAK